MHYYDTIWKVAIYIRISNNDGDDESESVANQREIIKKYIDNLDDGEYIIVDEYIDDGISGTTDEKRTAFQRMLKDIQAGKVNCVIVKDLARSFRNYSDQGYYLDDWFPRYNVRFISLYHQPLDTFHDHYNIRNIMIPIQGIINENYSAELSVKVRIAKEAQRKRGEYTGNCGVYGYIRNPENIHQLIIEPEAACVVKTIFEQFVNGMNRTAIARYLNENGILCPSEYRKKKLNLNYRPYFAERSSMPLWSTTTVTAILKNQMYCGDMVQGRQHSKSYKINKMEMLPEEEWVIVEKTHEPIIPRETFELTQNLLDKSYKPKRREKYEQLYSGLIYCGDCGKAMFRSGTRTKQGQYYACNTHRVQSKTICTKHYITERQLNEVVLKAIQQRVYLVCEYERILNAADKQIEVQPICRVESTVIESKNKEIQRHTFYKRKAYTDWKEGRISKKEYHELKDDYETMIKNLKNEIMELEKNAADVVHDNKSVSSIVQVFKKYKNITELTREMIITFVQRIEIYEGRIKILFKAKDDLIQIDEQMQSKKNS